MERFQGWVEQGGVVVVGPSGTAGGGGSTVPSGVAIDIQESFPGATVTVYLAGTTTLASIQADKFGTPKVNPFVADATGFWFFYAAPATYDVQFTGGGLPAPYTLTDVTIQGSAAHISDLLGPAYVSVCDYPQGPGGDVGQQINNAISALPAVGGTVDCRCLVGNQVVLSNPFNGVTKPVNLLLGAVSLTTSVSWVIPSNACITGAGESSQILVAAGTGVYTTGDINILTTNGASNVLIENIRVTGAGKSYAGANLSFGIAIQAVSSTNVVVAKTICENANMGICIDNSSDCRVVNNFVHGKIVQEGIRVFTTPGGTALNNIIANNTLDWQGLSTTGSGIDAGGQNNTSIPIGTVIANNTITGVSAEGINVFHANGTTVIGNISKANNYGLALYGGQGNVFSGNVCRDCPVTGILIQTLQAGDVLDDNIISGNTVINCSTNATDDAIYVSADNGGASCNGNKIQNNTIIGGAGNSVHLLVCTNTSVDHNTMLTPAGNGVQLNATANQTQIHGNLIVDPAFNGINSGAANRCNISNNTIRLTTGALGTSGIVTNVTNSVVADNQVSGFATGVSSTGAGTINLGNSDPTSDYLLIGAAGYVQIGGGGQPPASAGAIRLANNFSIKARNVGNTNDITALVVAGSNQVTLGENLNANTIVQGTTAVDTQVGGASVFTAAAASITVKQPLTATTGSILNGGVLIGAGAPVATAAGQLSPSGTVGFGNGAAGTAVTTTLKGTGTGPTAPQVIAGYLQFSQGNSTIWVPYFT